MSAQFTPELGKLFTEISQEETEHLLGLLEAFTALKDGDTSQVETLGAHWRAMSENTLSNLTAALESFKTTEREEFNARVEAENKERKTRALHMALSVVGGLIAGGFIDAPLDDWLDDFQTAVLDTADILELQIEMRFK